MSLNAQRRRRRNSCISRGIKTNPKQWMLKWSITVHRIFATIFTERKYGFAFGTRIILESQIFVLKLGNLSSNCVHRYSRISNQILTADTKISRKWLRSTGECNNAISNGRRGVKIERLGSNRLGFQF